MAFHESSAALGLMAEISLEREAVATNSGNGD
jgi:hypothetical protein